MREASCGPVQGHSKAPRPLERDGAQREKQTTTRMIPQSEKKVKPSLYEIARKNGAKTRDMVEAVRSLYPGYDAALQSKCEHGERYGVRLREDAEKLLIYRFAPEAGERPSRRRRLKAKRVTCRLSEANYSGLQQAIRASGTTIQAVIEGTVIDFIARHTEKNRGQEEQHHEQ